jgi:hypothetical protein
VLINQNCLPCKYFIGNYIKSWWIKQHFFFFFFEGVALYKNKNKMGSRIRIGLKTTVLESRGTADELEHDCLRERGHRRTRDRLAAPVKVRVPRTITAAIRFFENFFRRDRQGFWRNVTVTTAAVSRVALSPTSDHQRSVNARDYDPTHLIIPSGERKLKTIQ